MCCVGLKSYTGGGQDETLFYKYKYFHICIRTWACCFVKLSNLSTYQVPSYALACSFVKSFSYVDSLSKLFSYVLQPEHKFFYQALFQVMSTLSMLLSEEGLIWTAG